MVRNLRMPCPRDQFQERLRNSDCLLVSFDHADQLEKLQLVDNW